MSRDNGLIVVQDSSGAGICQLIPNTHVGFPDIDADVHYDVGPDPPHKEDIDSQQPHYDEVHDCSHWQYHSYDPPHWQE